MYMVSTPHMIYLTYGPTKVKQEEEADTRIIANT